MYFSHHTTRSHLCMLFDGTRTAYSQPYEVFYYISTHEDDFFALLRVLVRLHLYYPTKSVKVEDEIYILIKLYSNGSGINTPLAC